MPREPQRVPADGSLRQILVLNNRSRLWVYPQQWTDQHLDALRVRVHRRLEDNVHPTTVVYNSLRALLKPGNSAQYDPVLQLKTWVEQKFQFLFFYGKAPQARLQVEIVVCDAETNAPVLAFDVREPSLGLRRGFLQADRLSTISPYNVSILIAMAQQARHCLAGFGGIGGPMRVHLVTPNSDACSLHLFTAEISPEYLSGLDDPYAPFDWDLNVERESVTFSQLTSVFKRIISDHPLIKEDWGSTEDDPEYNAEVMRYLEEIDAVDELGRVMEAGSEVQERVAEMARAFRERDDFPIPPPPSSPIAEPPTSPASTSSGSTSDSLPEPPSQGARSRKRARHESGCVP